MRSRVVLLAAALALAVPAASSAAPVCKLVEDKAGDASLNPLTGSAYNVKSLDIRSFDVATGKKTLVAVLRLASTKPADDPVANALGVTWTVNFKISGASYAFSRKVANGQATDTATSEGAAMSGVKVTTTADSVTWTVSRSAISRLKAKKARIDGFFAKASSPGFFDQAPDSGYASEKYYTDGTASCVRAA